MSRAESVVGTLGATREAGDPAALAQSGHRFAAAGENLVRIALVAYIPHDAVGRRVEDVMQRDRQFHRTEVRGEMPTGTGDRFHQKVAQLRCELWQIVGGKSAQVGGRVDTVEQGAGHGQNARSTTKSANWRRRRADAGSVSSAAWASARISCASSRARDTPSRLT